jgi:aminoglycoside phosphotransferase (APT) family kinase protein
MAGSTLRLDDRIAQGNTSDIWPWTSATVVKVLHADIPRQWASIEADIVERVHAAGLPVPATDGVVEIDGRVGIVLERIEGVTMWERMKASAAEIPALVDALVQLQRELHACAVDGLPDLVRRMGSKIDEAVQVSASDRHLAQSLLGALPAGGALCHGDVHPANIVLADRGLVILDWFDAAVGPEAADLVRSSLLMRPSGRLGTAPPHLGGASGAFLDGVHCRYLATIMERDLIGTDEFATWEAVVAVARMSEPVPTDDLVDLWHLWRLDGSAAAETMIGRCLGDPRTPAASA